MDSLSEDLIWNILQRVPKGHGPSIRSVCTRFRELHPDRKGHVWNYLATPELFCWAVRNGMYMTEPLGKHLAKTGRKDLLEICWNEREHSRCVIREHTCLHAAKEGHLDLLVWAIEKGCEWNPEDHLHHAVENGHFHILRWGVSQGYPWPLDTSAAIVKNGDLACLQWALAHGCPLVSYIVEMATSFGHLHIIEWLHENGHLQNVRKGTLVTYLAARQGHLQILEWFRKHGYPWDENTCSFAADKGNLGVIQWLRSNGCPWDQSVVSSAIMNGHKEVFLWALENGLSWNPWFSEGLVKRGKLDILTWLYEQGYPLGDVLSIAREYGQESVVQWALEKNITTSI